MELERFFIKIGICTCGSSSPYIHYIENAQEILLRSDYLCIKVQLLVPATTNVILDMAILLLVLKVGDMADLP